jgi:lipoprotein-releasing system ATP-binding protein
VKNGIGMIEVKGLAKSFFSGQSKVDVLRGIDLLAMRGERVAIVGTSGAGKTTFMHILGALDHPTAGKVLFEGTDIFSLKGPALDDFRNQTIGFIFQFHQLLPEFSALENVMMPALIARKNFKEAVSLAGNLLEEVGLGHRLTHKPGQLSGGEQQRVAIARALVLSPRLLLADEPTGNLDSNTSDKIYQLLHQLHQTRRFTIIFVTHNETLAERMDRVVHIEDGRII